MNSLRIWYGLWYCFASDRLFIVANDAIIDVVFVCCVFILFYLISPLIQRQQFFVRLILNHQYLFILPHFWDNRSNNISKHAFALFARIAQFVYTLSRRIVSWMQTKIQQVHLQEWTIRFAEQKTRGLTIKQWCEQFFKNSFPKPAYITYC